MKGVLRVGKLRVSIKCNYPVFAVDTSVLNSLSDFITKLWNPEKHATGNITRWQYFYRCFFLLAMHDWLWVLLHSLKNVKIRHKKEDFINLNLSSKSHFPFFLFQKVWSKLENKNILMGCLYVYHFPLLAVTRSGWVSGDLMWLCH